MNRFLLLLTAAFCLAACMTDALPQRRTGCHVHQPDSPESRECWETQARDGEAARRDRIVRETLERSGRQMREARERDRQAPRFQLTGG